MTLPYTQLHPRLTMWQRSLTPSWKSYKNQCCRNQLSPHPGKTNYMLLTRGRHFVGPLQQISLGAGNTVKLVESSRCLGVQLDNELKWDTHVNELIKSYTKKLNLLRSMHFLPVKPRTHDLYFKVILPSVTYGIAVWVCTLFTELEKTHVRAAKIIHKLNWVTPSEEVLQRVKRHTLKTDYITRVLVVTYTSKSKMAYTTSQGY